jgi:hypothetical protein
MTATLTVRDENLNGDSLREWALEVLSERMSVRELIRSRVYQEVQDYNLQQGQDFHGLVQPEEAEKTLNGWKLKKPRLIDWQAEALDAEFTIGQETTVTFLRLTPLVGG